MLYARPRREKGLVGWLNEIWANQNCLLRIVKLWSFSSHVEQCCDLFLHASLLCKSIWRACRNIGNSVHAKSDVNFAENGRYFVRATVLKRGIPFFCWRKCRRYFRKIVFQYTVSLVSRFAAFRDVFPLLKSRNSGFFGITRVSRAYVTKRTRFQKNKLHRRVYPRYFEKRLMSSAHQVCRNAKESSIDARSPSPGKLEIKSLAKLRVLN